MYFNSKFKFTLLSNICVNIVSYIVTFDSNVKIFMMFHIVKNLTSKMLKKFDLIYIYKILCMKNSKSWKVVKIRSIL